MRSACAPASTGTLLEATPGIRGRCGTRWRRSGDPLEGIGRCGEGWRHHSVRGDLQQRATVRKGAHAMTDARGHTSADLAIDDRQTRPKNVGARVRRTEDPRLLTGRGVFVDDRHVKGVLHVAFRRSDHPHARIVSIDTAAAAALPRVAAVLTAPDISDA